MLSDLFLLEEGQGVRENQFTTDLFLDTKLLKSFSQVTNSREKHINIIHEIN